MGLIPGLLNKSSEFGGHLVWCNLLMPFSPHKSISAGNFGKGAPYSDSLKPLGLRGCVVCLMWCDVGGVVGGGWGLVKVCIFHNQKCTST